MNDRNGRRASCACGQLSIATQALPEIVAACSCLQCQARTGSVFSVHAFFPEATSTISGDSRAYNRKADSGRMVEFHFCPNCGSTVYWKAEARPESWGVAAGAFKDPAFPAPVAAVWAETKANWVELPRGIPILQKGAPPQS